MESTKIEWAAITESYYYYINIINCYCIIGAIYLYGDGIIGELADL